MVGRSNVSPPLDAQFTMLNGRDQPVRGFDINDCRPHVQDCTHDPSNAVSNLSVSQFNRHLFKEFSSSITSILAIHLNRLAKRLS